ncbi:unnamed protein product [Mycena citricolor]|uniref:Uncharacterized protein n=1 Tax=Mycena citricolor TaxID=2018698 RepID=A0AAD2GZ29_9AGAR|nr:unnamed protein product [Mycena citricolor]
MSCPSSRRVCWRLNQIDLPMVITSTGLPAQPSQHRPPQQVVDDTRTSALRRDALLGIRHNFSRCGSAVRLAQLGVQSGQHVPDRDWRARPPARAHLELGFQQSRVHAQDQHVRRRGAGLGVEQGLVRPELDAECTRREGQVEVHFTETYIDGRLRLAVVFVGGVRKGDRLGDERGRWYRFRRVVNGWWRTRAVPICGGQGRYPGRARPG